MPIMGGEDPDSHRRVPGCRRVSIQFTPVYVSLEDFPNSESPRITGYDPGFVGSMNPEAAIARKVSMVLVMLNVWWMLLDGPGFVWPRR